MGALSGLLAAKKVAGSDEEDEAPASSKGTSTVEGELADDAFDAIKSGDKKAFRSAFVAAVRACVEGDYDEEE